MQQGSGPLVLYLFDVLEIDGEPLVELPLAERHERLQALIDKRNKTVRVSDLFDDGDALFEAATAQRLEGIVSKRADSRYEAGRRSRNWLKVKTQGRQELVVAGYTKGQGRRSNGFGALVLGVNEKGVLRWAGNVGTGFDEAEIARLLAKLKPLRARRDAVRGAAEDAEGAQGGRRLGRADARRRDPLRRVDARRPAAGTGLRGAARGQGGE